MSMGTASQNGQGWKGSLEVILPNCMLKQGNLEPVAKDHVQMAFECFQGWGLPNNPGQHVPVLGHLHCQ